MGKQLDLFHTQEEIKKMKVLNFKLKANPSLIMYIYGDIDDKKAKQELQQLRDKIK